MRRARSISAPVLSALPWTICLIALLGCARAASAQASDRPSTVESDEQTDAGRSPHPTRLYVSMWTLHLREPRRTIENNWLIGVTYRGYFAGTFLNSFGKRAYTAGIQRSIARVGEGAVRLDVGYRVGAISGYDGRFTRLARKTPVLPIGSAYAIVEYRRVGVEVAYTFVVTSAAFTFRF